MSPFAYRNGILCAEEVPLPRIAAEHGTPCYVYSRAALLSRFDAFRQALAGRDALICYAVKANSNLAILNQFARAGAGFDIVSGGELARVLAAGGDPAKVVFSGVGKTIEEMRQALATGIFCFNVESAEELGRLNELAGQSGKKAPIAIRVNPDVDPKTHPYISTGLRSNKFGVAYGEAFALYLRARALPHVDIAGIACHIGSQLLDPAPAAEAAGKILVLADRLADAGIPCVISTLAAASASATATKRRLPSPTISRRSWRSWRGARKKSSSSPGAHWSAMPASCSPASNT